MNKLLINGRFNIERWREILKYSGEQMPLKNCQTLAPFGFEVTNDNSFLKKYLNRFYCYFGNEFEDEASLNNEELFKNILFEEIKKSDIDFFRRISIIVFQEDKRKTIILNEISKSDIMINIEQRVYKTSIIENYAQYVACCLFEFEKRTLPELLRFDKNLT